MWLKTRQIFPLLIHTFHEVTEKQKHDKQNVLKSTGPDGIHQRIVRELSDVLAVKTKKNVLIKL